MSSLVNFFNRGSCTAGTRVGFLVGHTIWHPSWHTITRHATTRCSTLLVKLGDDGAADGLHLLLLVLELVHLGQLVAVQPFHSILTFAADRFLLILRDLILQLLIFYS